MQFINKFFSNFNHTDQALAKLLIAWQQHFLLYFVDKAYDSQAVLSNVYLLMQTFFKPDLSLEIGAFNAAYSQKLRLMFPDIDIVAVEASPLVYNHFKKIENFENQKIIYLNMAVSDNNNPIEFNLVDEDDFISSRNSMLPRKDLPSKTVSVNAITGDSLLESFKDKNQISLWIDVEGATDRVLKGLKQTIKERKVSSILLEVENCVVWEGQWMDHELIAFFLEHKYIPFFCDIQFPNAFMKPEYGGAIGDQYNIAFARLEDVDYKFIQHLMYACDMSLKKVQKESAAEGEGTS